MSRSILSIIASLAKEMGAFGFSAKASGVWKEIRSSIEKPAGKDRKLLLAFQPVDPSVPAPAGKRTPKKTATKISWPDHSANDFGSYLYRGNRLEVLVPDLKSLKK
jgi:hypothetical protein